MSLLYPVTYQFKLTPAAILALNGLTLPVRVMTANACGVSSGDLTAVMASGAFNNRDLERLYLLMRRIGQPSRTVCFLQTSP